MSTLIRKPAVSGRFYSGTEIRLKEELEACFMSPFGPGDKKIGLTGSIFGGVVPHAGYMFSGPVAAWFYQALKNNIKEKVTFVILGPNHTGRGSYVSLYPPDGVWETPLGKVKINKKLAEKISECRLVEIDETAHILEHSIEVQLPFLQYIFPSSSSTADKAGRPDFDFVPICLMKQDLTTALELGAFLGKVAFDQKIVFIASSDFSHYVPPEAAKKNDSLAISAIEGLDVSLMMKNIQKYDISMCGYGPIGAVMSAVKNLGSNKGKLLHYGHSGDIQPMDKVVGYASIVFI
ncbi:MAG: AmmeMemoRadiSam system protein B [bacterium]|nr:AmmeMemoRadiSam system protein B [bacterium]